MLSTPIVFPSLLQCRLEHTVKQFLKPEGSTNYPVDFLQPAGEPALAAPDSVSWQVFKNPIALFIGGITGVLLELAEPRVREGIWQNTTFKNAPLRRLQRTGLAAMVTVYGPRSQAEMMIAGVRKMHSQIAGTTPCGQRFHANEPELLSWVHATASFGFLHAYGTYVRPFDLPTRNRFYAEAKTSAGLFGATNAPASEREIHDFFGRMHDKLEPSPVIFDFLNIMCHAPLLPLPGPLRKMQKILVMSAIDLLPHSIRERLQLTGQWTAHPRHLWLTRQVSAAAEKVLIRSFPAVQACVRLGLPEHYLYR